MGENGSVALVKSEPVRNSLAALVPANLTEAMKLAEVMARCSMVPQHLQGKPADCFLVIEQAMRWSMSPFAVAQCTSAIKGKLMFEGKLVAAVINTRGELQKRLNYEYSGEGEKRSIRVVGCLRGEEKDRDVVVELAKAKTENSQWKSQPDQQLMYHGVRVWARRHLPEHMLGVYSPEEMGAAEAVEQEAVPVKADEEKEEVTFCTPPQRSKFYALAKQLVGDDGKIKAWLKEKLETQAEVSTKTISKDKMARLIADLENMEVK
jgi:hypothetical protein